MKKPLYFRFSFEMVFACTIVAVFILPAIVYGQSVQKRIEIIIENGDTTVNGKKMKEMTAAERKDALGLFNDNAVPASKKEILKRFSVSPDGNIRFTGIPGDSVKNFTFNYKIDTAQGDKRSTYTYTYRGPQDRMPRLKPDMRNYNMPTLKGKMHMTDPADIPSPRYRFTPRNQQNFSFNNVDENGIATTITFNVADASLNEAKRVNVIKNDLDIKDLTLTPEFSTGKTWLMFSLDTKATATVQLTNSDGRIIWSDRSVDGTFRKNFSLPVNGLYLLKVQQGTKFAVKRIVKE